MKRNVLVALALVALAAAPAAAEVKKHPTAKVEIDVPSTWKMDGKADVMTLADPTNEVGIILIVTEAKDLQKVVGELDKQLAKVATDIKWAKPKPEAVKLNGMDALANRGTGKVSGKDANLGLLLVHTPADKILLVVAMVEAAKDAQHKAEIDKLISSIKPST